MQFRKTIIVTVVAALTLALAPMVHADDEWNPFNVLGTLLGAAAGAAVGYQIGQGHGNAAAIAGGAVIGAFAGKKIADTINSQDQQTYYSSSSGCMLHNSGCGDWHSEHLSGNTHVVKAGYWQNDESQQCRCFNQTIKDASGNDILDRNGNPTSQVVCVTYALHNRHWVAGHQVPESQVIVTDKRLNELWNKYYGHTSDRISGSTSGSHTGGSSTTNIYIGNGGVPCTVDSVFFDYRFAYLDNHCHTYVDAQDFREVVDGSKVDGALQQCKIAAAKAAVEYPGDPTKAITECAAIVYNNQVIQ